MKNPTLTEFADGAPITYPAAKGKNKTCTATLVGPDTVAVQDPKGVVTFAAIEPDRVAPLYYNLTRSRPDA